MKVRTFTPDPAIADYISHIVVLENDSMFYEATLPLIANGFPSITFQLTDPARILQPGRRADQLVLYGQNIRPIQLHTAGEITVIACFLYPYMLYPLFGYSAGELTDQAVDLSLTEPARSINLKEQLLNAPALPQRLQLMTDYIQRLAGLRKTSVDERIVFATRRIQAGKGTSLLIDLQQELYVTERTLQRLFEQHVGLTPKLYSRICQFHASLQHLNRNKFTDMSGVAFENGYADQSHLIRAFKEFTNYSPLEYLRQADCFPA
jgi:AraC-like DNA-binding protein